MDARPVDPRVIRWELSSPTYHVYFWDTPGSTCDEWELVGAADVLEVLDWAKANVKTDWTYTVHAVVRKERNGWGAVRLLGVDPA